MALADLSFKLFTDSNLTDEFSGLYQLSFRTDLSDPQDLVLYLGSPLESPVFRELKAESNPGVDDILLMCTDILPAWLPAHAYTSGYLVEATTPNGKKYRCTTGGTSHASIEPTWVTVGLGSTMLDNTVVWTLLGNKHPTTEIKLATTLIGLDSAIAGAALNLGPLIESGVANAIPIYMRLTNAVTTVGTNTGFPEIALFINTVTENEA